VAAAPATAKAKKEAANIDRSVPFRTERICPYLPLITYNNNIIRTRLTLILIIDDKK